MKQVLQVGAALLALGAANAWATQADASEWYGALRVGQTINTDVSGISFEDGEAYGAGLGTSIGPVRVEGGVSRLSGDLNFGGPSIQADALDYHATAYLDLPVGENASLFAGAGVDYVDAEALFFGNSIDANGTGYHWAVGGAYRLRDGLMLEARYRQIEADVDADFIGDVDLSASELTLGLRMRI